MMPSKRKILVTAALPYANGPLHLGHLLEFIQTDIWVRFQRLRGNTCYFICGSDAHGTPIMLNAEKQGVAPETLVAQINQDHRQTLTDFDIGLDNFYTTHSSHNQTLAADLFERLKARGDIRTQDILQAFDTQKNLFLPDRYVKGTCPRCKAPDQYGDACEACGATYTPLDLIDPKSVLTQSTPVPKLSRHYFFCLEHYAETLATWLDNASLQPEVKHKLQEWFTEGLQSWDISRDAPYFGFLIPGETDKYFYVWMDAPIGYMASFLHYCEQTNQASFKAFWDANTDTELYHFIGKDIIYFHGLFWPAMLSGSGYRTPTSIFAHGFLTINGQKMSKSRGTFITAKQYIDTLNPAYLRYYLAAKLSDGIDDIDLNFDDFLQRVNSDLIGKYINIGSRVAGFLEKAFDNRLSPALADPALYQQFLKEGDTIAAYYESRQYVKAMRAIMTLADKANQFIDQQKPWQLMRDESKHSEVQSICTMGINLFYLLTVYLAPVLPVLAKRVQAFLQYGDLQWDTSKPIAPLLDHTIASYEPLLTRLEETHLNPLKSTPMMTDTAPIQDDTTAHISIDDFMKVELRVGKIIEAHDVPEAGKLLRLMVDLGKEQRQIFAGIKQYYTPEQLVGQLVVVVANLAPRKMRFGLSEGMVLCASEGEIVKIVTPSEGSQPGMIIK